MYIYGSEKREKQREKHVHTRESLGSAEAQVLPVNVVKVAIESESIETKQAVTNIGEKQLGKESTCTYTYIHYMYMWRVHVHVHLELSFRPILISLDVCS